jgi:Zn-dependent protease with chaperone function
MKTLSRFWKKIKAGFRVRQIVCCCVVISAVFFGFFLHPLIKLLWSIVFLVSSELFVLMYAPSFISNYWLLLTHSKTIERPMPKEFSDLADKAGVLIKKFKTKPGLRNAYVLGKTLVIGEPLLEELSGIGILGVIGHELGHIKRRDGLFRPLSILPIVALALLSWSKLPPVMSSIALLAYTMVMMTPINWHLECKADKFSRDLVGKDAIKSALLHLGKKEKIDEPSEFHPSIAKRIKKLDEE